MVSINRLDKARRAQVVRCLIEGCSIRATVRMTGASKNTIVKLLVDLADACVAYHDRHVRNLKVRRLHCDEIRNLAGAKAKNVTAEQKAEGWGDTWTWTALDVDTKLCISYLVGGRDLGSAIEFMQDCAKRISNRVQITIDGHKAYLEAVESGFGEDIDYPQLQNVYGLPSEDHKRYSPEVRIGCDTKVVSGNPDPKHVSTSFAKRQNLSMRISIRRFALLTNAFFKKVENHAAAVALWFIYYNFCRVHQSLGTTPAMESGISAHVWTIEELAALLDSN